MNLTLCEITEFKADSGRMPANFFCRAHIQFVSREVMQMYGYPFA
ncbi:hypothetical protein [Spirosoma horti]